MFLFARLMNGCKIRRYTSPRQYPIVCILPTCLRYSRPTLPAEEYQFGLLTELVWVSDRHGVCPYMRPTGRIGIDWVDGVSTYVRIDPEG